MSWRQAWKISTPLWWALLIVLGSGWAPMWKSPVPQESTENLSSQWSCLILWLNKASAKGERQMLPRHTKRIFIMDGIEQMTKRGRKYNYGWWNALKRKPWPEEMQLVFICDIERMIQLPLLCKHYWFTKPILKKSGKLTSCGPSSNKDWLLFKKSSTGFWPFVWINFWTADQVER